MHDGERANPHPPTTERPWGERERARILPRLVPVTPAELADATAEGRRRVLERVVGALASERRRGRARHWSYSLARHAGLIEALDAELALWRAEGRTPPRRIPRPPRLPGRRAVPTCERRDR